MMHHPRIQIPLASRAEALCTGILALVICLTGSLQTASTSSAAVAPSLQETPSEASQVGDVAIRARTEAERLRSERRAFAQRLAVHVPFYSIVDGMETTLFLMNNVSDPIAVDVTVRNDEGQELALGQFVIEPLNHEEIALSHLLMGFEREFGSGSVRCELLGDSDTLQGWAVVSDDRGETFELPFATAEAFESTRLRGFWDWAAPGLGTLSTLDLYLLNTTDVNGRGLLRP